MQTVAFIFLSALGVYCLVMSPSRAGALLRLIALVTLEVCLLIWAVGFLTYPALEISGPAWLKAAIDDFFVAHALRQMAGDLPAGISILLLAVVPPLFAYLEIRRLLQRPDGPAE